MLGTWFGPIFHIHKFAKYTQWLLTVLLLLILYHYITITIYLFIYFGTFYLNMAFFSVIHLPERNTVIQYDA